MKKNYSEQKAPFCKEWGKITVMKTVKVKNKSKDKKKSINKGSLKLRKAKSNMKRQKGICALWKYWPSEKTSDSSFSRFWQLAFLFSLFCFATLTSQPSLETDVSRVFFRAPSMFNLLGSSQDFFRFPLYSLSVLLFLCRLPAWLVTLVRLQITVTYHCFSSSILLQAFTPSIAWWKTRSRQN